MKIWLIVAIVLVVTGSLLFVGIMTFYQWDFTRLSTVKFETNEFVADRNFSNISINTDTADVVFLPSADNICRVFCNEKGNEKHSVSIENDTLIIHRNDQRKWYEYIGISFGTPKITVYLSRGQYYALSIQESTGDIDIPVDLKFESMDIRVTTGNVTNHAYTSGTINIKADTGDIFVKNIHADSMNLNVTTGKITAVNIICEEDIQIAVTTGKTQLHNIICKNIFSTGNTGDITLEHVVAKDFLSAKRTTGSIRLNSCDAAKLYIKTTTGDVTGSLLTGKIFVTHTSTGDVDIPPTTIGGTCEIYTTTGDIKMTLGS